MNTQSTLPHQQIQKKNFFHSYLRDTKIWNWKRTIWDVLKSHTRPTKPNMQNGKQRIRVGMPQTER